MKSVVVTIILLIASFSPDSNDRSIEKVKHLATPGVDSAYESAVSVIKEHEGFVGSVYLCPAGQATIGYGHAMRSGDPRSVTEAQADSMLRADLDSCMGYVSRRTKLTGNRLVAIAHFAYCFGGAKLEKSTLLQRILAGKPIDDVILNYVNYKKIISATDSTSEDTCWIQSAYLLKMRKWELDLYLRGI